MDENKYKEEVPSYEDIKKLFHRIHDLEDRVAKLSQRVVALEKSAGRNY